METKELIQIGMFLIAVLGILWNFAYGKGKSDQLEANLNLKIDQHITDNQREIGNLRNQVNRQWEWKDAHEKDAGNMRLELQKQIGKVEAGLSIHDNQYGEILRLIESIGKNMNEKIDKLESKIEAMGRN